MRMIIVKVRLLAWGLWTKAAVRMALLSDFMLYLQSSGQTRLSRVPTQL